MLGRLPPPPKKSPNPRLRPGPASTSRSSRAPALRAGAARAHLKSSRTPRFARERLVLAEARHRTGNGNAFVSGLDDGLLGRRLVGARRFRAVLARRRRRHRAGDRHPRRIVAPIGVVAPLVLAEARHRTGNGSALVSGLEPGSRDAGSSERGDSAPPRAPTAAAPRSRPASATTRRADLTFALAPLGRLAPVDRHRRLAQELLRLGQHQRRAQHLVHVLDRDDLQRLEDPLRDVLQVLRVLLRG